MKILLSLLLATLSLSVFSKVQETQVEKVSILRYMSMVILQKDIAIKDGAWDTIISQKEGLTCVIRSRQYYGDRKLNKGMRLGIEKFRQNKLRHWFYVKFYNNPDVVAVVCNGKLANSTTYDEFAEMNRSTLAVY